MFRWVHSGALVSFLSKVSISANHDECVSGGECGVPMYNRYHMPDNGNSLFWYSYDYGLVHMITISTEHNFTIGSTQYQWLLNDLKSVDRKKTPWIILGESWNDNDC